MAIKISGTTVIDDSRNLTNIGTIKGIDYPATDGSAGQALITDGAGSLSLQDPVRPGPQVDAVASGTLPDGSPVIVNSDGTVSVASLVTESEELGTETVFNTSSAAFTSATYDSAAGKVVITYNSSSGGTAIVGTVSGSSISFGSEVVFLTSSTKSWITYDSGTGKVVIVYRNDNFDGTAIVGTVSGSSISFGSPVVFRSHNFFSQVDITYDSASGKVVIVYREPSNFGEAIVGTVSGSSISFGSEVVFNSNGTANPSITYDSASGKVIIAYQDFDQNQGSAIVGTVSGSSISFGSEVVFRSNSIGDPVTTYDSVSGKVVIVYPIDNGGGPATAIVGTVSGSSISFGSEFNFNSGNSGDRAASYASVFDKVIIAYRDGNNSDFGTLVVGTVSGSSISFGSPVVFSSVESRYMSITHDPTEGKSVISYEDRLNNDFVALTYSPEFGTPNLTSENFIGFSDAAYSDSQTATIQIIGSTNTDQSGLTPGQSYFVQTDGSLAETPDNPEVFAGTALSNTDLLIKF